MEVYLYEILLVIVNKIFNLVNKINNVCDISVNNTKPKPYNGLNYRIIMNR